MTSQAHCSILAWSKHCANRLKRSLRNTHGPFNDTPIISS
jgi:hypothetical protein